MISSEFSPIRAPGDANGRITARCERGSVGVVTVLRVALAQLNPTVGGLDGNLQR